MSTLLSFIAVHKVFYPALVENYLFGSRRPRKDLMKVMATADIQRSEGHPQIKNGFELPVIPLPVLLIPTANMAMILTIVYHHRLWETTIYHIEKHRETGAEHHPMWRHRGITQATGIAAKIHLS